MEKRAQSPTQQMAWSIPEGLRKTASRPVEKNNESWSSRRDEKALAYFLIMMMTSAYESFFRRGNIQIFCYSTVKLHRHFLLVAVMGRAVFNVWRHIFRGYIGGAHCSHESLNFVSALVFDNFIYINTYVHFDQLSTVIDDNFNNFLYRNPSAKFCHSLSLQFLLYLALLCFSSMMFIWQHLRVKILFSLPWVLSFLVPCLSIGQLTLNSMNLKSFPIGLLT